MSLPKINFAPRSGVQFQLTPRALDRWNPSLQAATNDDASISILDVIGYDFWTGEGVTAKRISAALRSIGDRDVTVNVNSPGGDMFEGIAIYNMLREHKGHVTVKVLGMAASAASIIAMAGDTIEIGRPSFLMIHNGWMVAAGNRHEFREIADWMEQFDSAMTDVYTARAGMDAGDVAEMMDKETWIGGAKAIEQGFADAMLESDQVKEGEGKANAAAVRRLEAALRASGLPQSEAKRLLSEIKSGLRDVPGSGERDATERGQEAPAADTAALLQTLITNMELSNA